MPLSDDVAAATEEEEEDDNGMVMAVKEGGLRYHHCHGVSLLHAAYVCEFDVRREKRSDQDYSMRIRCR